MQRDGLHGTGVKNANPLARFLAHQTLTGNGRAARAVAATKRLRPKDASVRKPEDQQFAQDLGILDPAADVHVVAESAVLVVARVAEVLAHVRNIGQ